jgi:RimJ/RimL family protein N-acetyltransferase
VGASFVFEPLGPEHNERDYEAWGTSIEHIRATHGYAGRSWPAPMTLAENLRDLERHRDEFEQRAAFAYTVLDPDDDAVIGCVYVDPDPAQERAALVRSWVRATHAELDRELRATVVAWLERDWPFASVSCPAE